MEQVNDIAHRLKKIIESSGMNNNSFAKSVGKSYSNIASVLDGKVKPGFDFITAILKQYPQINSAWLITGEGEMLLEATPKNESRPDNYLQEYLKELEKRFQKLLDQKDKLIESQQYLIEHLEGQLGKPECVTETGVLEHPATAAMLLEGLGQRA